MGAWGAGPFENDDALDWVWELEDDTDGSVIIDTLRLATKLADSDYLDVDDANNAVAAAEIVASPRGERSAGLPTEASVWLDANGALVDAAMRATAHAAVTRVSENSEARDLWDDAGSPAWGDYIAALLGRLA